MSSDSSESSSGSRIRQFGLYRTIDARTEEFLRLSRRRQIRQGCVCAAISTAITVTVVVVILLIYEYAIAVEWSLVQRRRGNGTAVNVTIDSPYADKLDRSYFGFDQDYFERMPLLVNALQESNYVDPVVEMSRPVMRKMYFNRSQATTQRSTHATDIYRRKPIRRTSPRPFFYEYRSATPLPFSKTFGSRSWVDSYRNAQRLQNIRQVIKYLEKTINAKSADMNAKSNAHTSIAFTGVYVEPKTEKPDIDDQESELLPQSSEKVETFHANHQEDPLFRFKPDSPGEVNLLAESMLRFSPIPTPSLLEESTTRAPMFRRVPYYKKNCVGNRCDNTDTLQTTEYTTEMPRTTKSFSVMLNLYPMKNRPESRRPEVRTKPPLEKIYLTTSKPLVQFRQRPTTPPRRSPYRYKKPRYLIRNKEERDKVKPNITTNEVDNTKSTTMFVHVNVYSPEDKTERPKSEDVETTTKKFVPSTQISITEAPIELAAGQVEDYHDGSSGIIHINPLTETPILPQVTTILPFFESASSGSEINTWQTSPPDVLKFSPEDAKVPDHYLAYDTTIFPSAFDTTPYAATYDTTPYSSTPYSSTPYASTEMSRRFSVETDQDQHEVPLVIKLRNKIDTENSTPDYETSPPEDEEVPMETTTQSTYVPLINGHYRSVHRTVSNGTDVAEEKSDSRKRKLEMSVSGFRTYVPMYVEIKRNKTRGTDDGDEGDSE